MNKKFKISDLKIISNQSGNVRKILDVDCESFYGFGEAYYSEIKYGNIKGWKMHAEMTLNLTVSYGKVKFVIIENKGSRIKFNEYVISNTNHQRITIEPNVWFAFQGLEKPVSVVLNIANIKHNDIESQTRNLEDFIYDWGN